MVSSTDDHGRQPGGHRHRGRDRDDPRRAQSATSSADQFTYIGGADGHGPEPDQRSGGRRHAGDDHRHGFTGATAVDFGTTAATNVTVVSNTAITADSPAGTGVVDVTVTTPGGKSATSAADQFTYIAAPAVTGLSPTSGPAAGGTLVTITGTSFTGATAVDFGTTAATNVTVVSNTDDHGRQPRGHRHGGCHRDHAGRQVGHLVRRPVHLHRARRRSRA